MPSRTDPHRDPHSLPRADDARVLAAVELGYVTYDSRWPSKRRLQVTGSHQWDSVPHPMRRLTTAGLVVQGTATPRTPARAGNFSSAGAPYETATFELTDAGRTVRAEHNQWIAVEPNQRSPKLGSGTHNRFWTGRPVESTHWSITEAARFATCAELHDAVTSSVDLATSQLRLQQVGGRTMTALIEARTVFLCVAQASGHAGIEDALARPQPAYDIHLVRQQATGTPAPFLCGLPRFGDAAPSWNLAGGTSGPGVTQVPCGRCVAAAYWTYESQPRPIGSGVGAAEITAALAAYRTAMATNPNAPTCMQPA